MSNTGKKENTPKKNVGLASKRENKMSEANPELTPPIEESNILSGINEDRPTKEILEGLPPLTGAQEMPTEAPPELINDEDEGFGATAWHSSKKVTLLWSKNQNRNSWIAIEGVGWRRLANNSDTGVVALTMLAAHAKQLNRITSLKEDSGQIKEIYVW